MKIADDSPVLTEMEQAAYTLAAIVQSSDDAIVSKDLNGVIKSWNPAAERLFGWTEEEAIGKSIMMIIPDDRRDEETEVLSSVRSGRKVDHFETIRQRKDGSLVEISLTVSPVRDHDGRIIGASKIARDISDRRAAEEAVQNSNAIKDQFLTLVSHELRTPISIIVGNGHLLQRRGDSLSREDREQAVSDIAFEAERLQRIIENLLLLTRVEGGERIELDYIQIDRLAEQAISTFGRRSPTRIIDFEPSGTIPPAIGEPLLTLLVLENLISNADKYSPPLESIEVCVSANEAGEAEVHVLDRGIGLGSEDLEGLFAPFYRTAAAREAASGMGLGLAVCRRAVEEQGGRIGAAPRHGGGADFWFTLPLAPEAPFA